MWLQLIIMNIPSSPLRENLITFFQDCEKLLVHYNLQDFQRYEVEYKFTRQNDVQWTLSQDCKPKITWGWVRNHFEEKVNNLESINSCVDNLIKYFGLIYDIKKAGFISEEFINNSKSFRKQELVFLFFEYKKIQEEINLSITEFITFLIKGAQSKNIYFKIASQLVGFKTNLEEIKIGNFTIRKPTENELNRIMNDTELNIYKISNPDDIASVSSGSIENTHFWIFVETQQIRQKNPYVIHCLYQSSELNKNTGLIEIKNDFKKLLLALRLYNGNYVGIRSIFINKSFVYGSNYFERWREYSFINPNFANFLQISRSYDLISKEIYLEDVKRINNIYQDLIIYEQNQLKQIDCALDHYFKAFEQTYPVYIFTELIMSFETFIHKNDTDIGTATKKLKQLVPKYKRKNLKNFFHNKKDGCYEIRNNLFRIS